MLTPRVKAALVVLAASAGLSACTSYGPYGGSGVSLGVGYGSPYGYGYGYGSPYDNYYGYPYYGWYDGYYYPGSGYWMYDPWGRQYRIGERQENYWRSMLAKHRAAGGSAPATANFSGFRAKARSGATIPGVNLDAQASAQAQADRGSLQRIRDARREAQAEQRQRVLTERQQARTERQEARSSAREEFRQQVLERSQARRRGKPQE